MKYLTDGMEPGRVLRFFEDICGIPHGSGNESALAQYIIGIAEENGLEYETDQHGNVLVRLVSSPGCEDAPYFLMQGHMDMVCEKEPWCDIDMAKEPVRLRLDGHILSAEGTTLGADNAVGLCNMLAVMTDKSLKHPPMEFLFTVKEELGLVGIDLFDVTRLRSKRMMTMDCGDPDVIILGSAGQLSYDLDLQLGQEPLRDDFTCMALSVSGLHGGHTGLEAGSGYANALTMMTETLSALEESCGVRLCSLNVGGGMGSIPDSATAVIAVPPSACGQTDGSPESSACNQTGGSPNVSAVEDIAARMAAEYAEEFSITEPSMAWSIDALCGDAGTDCAATAEDAATAAIAKPEKMLTADSSRKLIDFMLFAPSGALKRHPVNQKQVLGSALIKGACLKDGRFTGVYTIRANNDSFKYRLGRTFERLCRRNGASCVRSGDSPAWPEKPGSGLTGLCVDVYKELFGREPSQELVHGGEEASVIASKRPEMEIFGIAPYSRGAHTPKERLDIDTMLPVWQFIKALLARLAEEKE